MTLSIPGFRTDQPAVGPAIFQNQTDDLLKVTGHRRGIFTSVQRSAHSSSGCAAQNYLNRGLQIGSKAGSVNLGGSGVQLQELHFTQMPVQTNITNGVVTDWNRDCKPPLQRRRRVRTTSLLNCRRRGIPWLDIG